ncbi:Protein of unknown function [Rubrobacter radiotolerans DSM 5868]|nr:Protein of unknown function [Rubrobacter radiotolerans DSM 5868]
MALALGDRRTPLLARALAFCVVAYALSPIDLIPDFIPVLGLLDDLVLLPLGLLLVRAVIPPEVLEDCRKRATSTAADGFARSGALLVALVWLVAATGSGLLLWRVFR